MVNIISMQDIRYLNLFGKITKVNTKLCFRYNEYIVFIVPERLLQKAMGKNRENIKKINEILKKKIKIIAFPRKAEDIKNFVELLTRPINFREIKVGDKEVVISANTPNKAMLIGRNKKRLFELQRIIEVLFRKELKII